MSKPGSSGLALALTLTLASVPGAAAQQNGPEACPPALRFGTVPVGGTVQGSTRLEWGADAAGDARVDAPPFVRVLYCRPDRLAIQLRLEAPGALEGTIRVHRGDRELAVPVAAVALPPLPGQTRVLFVDGPFDAQSTDDDAVFDPARRVVAAGKLAAHYVVEPVHGNRLDVDRLRLADVVLLCENGLLRLTDHDVTLLHGFVCGGGRVVVCASSFYAGTVRKANEVVEAFGLEMHDEEPPGAAVLRADADALAADPLAVGVAGLAWPRPTPTELRDERAQPLVTLDVYPAWPVAAVARTAGGGEVVTLGVPLWWTWIGLDPGNERLMRNLLTRAPR